MKHYLLPAVTAIVLAFATSVCMSADKIAGGDASVAIEAAKAAQKKADSVGGEWCDTAKLIKKAEKLASEGKTDEAMKLAKTAEIQGHAGYEQMQAQKVVGPRF